MAHTDLEKTHPHQQAIENLGKSGLSALDATGIVVHAAKAADIGRRTVYDHMNVDSDIADRRREAVATAEGSFVTELVRRAVENEKYLFISKPRSSGTTRNSDALLKMAIKSLRYRRERDMPKAPSRSVPGFKETDRLPPAKLKDTPPTPEAWTAPMAEILYWTQAEQGGAGPSDRT